ncbi:hypothetical protein C0991_003552 [Blastosporella zonata]|nr:hypothetical protein C0991_003552 [Blastosporella zonata]
MGSLFFLDVHLDSTTLTLIPVIDADLHGLNEAEVLQNIPAGLALSLPSDLSTNIGGVLRVVSALPRSNILTLAGSNIDIISPSQTIPALVTELQGFNHLKNLCLPFNALVMAIYDCLRHLRELREVEIVVIAAFPIHIKNPAPGDFPKLRTLKILGSFADLDRALDAFANPETTGKHLRKSVVKCRSAFNERDMANTFDTMLHRSPSIGSLSIVVTGQEVAEELDCI